MSNIAPLFSTAPRIKLKINGVDIAFAIGMNLNISVDIQPVQILGKFGPVSLEPTMYNAVTGTMQIIRLIAKEDMATAQAVLQAQRDLVNQGGNADQIQTFNTANGSAGLPVTQTTLESSNNPLRQSTLIRHMDPRSVLLSTTFDMELYMRVPDVEVAGVVESINQNNLDDPSPQQLNVQNGLKEVPWMTVRQCRLSSRNINISIGQLVNEPVSFQGIFMTTKNALGADMFFQDNGASV